MLLATLSEVESALDAQSPDVVSSQFFDLLSRAGATYLQTRLYRRPLATLTSATHWAAGGVVARFSPENWVGSAAFNYVCFECNPLLGAIRESRTRYRFSDFAPIGEPITLSPASASAGGGSVVAVDEGLLSLFLIQRGNSYELWATTLGCQ